MTTFKLDITQIFEGLDISGAVYNFITRVEQYAISVNNTISTWIKRAKDRKQLANMNDHMLKDIGLYRHEVQYEASKYFWQK